ncbi:DUF4143 domain-containing protein [bacterium]|nr:DUF4143 domain-containing protein [bacterium]
MREWSVKRFLDLEAVLQRKSAFLLGPRQTGKSWLIRARYSDARIFNLLDIELFRTLSKRPSTLREQIEPEDRLVVIDEIQLLPELLNEVHLLIEERGTTFLLTGSSARKLRRAGVNLLGGRATQRFLFPFVRRELREHFELDQALSRGLLPSIYFSDDYRSDLRDYVELYLKEEVAAESLVRSLPAYSRFLDVAALSNSYIINYTKIADDAQIAPSTVREYFHILRDTLLIERLPPWRESKKRKATAKDKFYFFDVGVVRYLQGRRELIRDSVEYGEALETYLFHELRAYCSYVSRDALSYWRTSTGHEVDFLLGDHTAIEVKATRNVSFRDLKGLQALQEEQVFRRYILVAQEERRRTVDGIEIIPLHEFLDELWRDAGEGPTKDTTRVQE